MKITVIGAGNMGGALVKGWAAAVRSGKASHELTATSRTGKTFSAIASQYPEVRTTTDNLLAVKDADVVVIAVKPWLVDEVMAEISDSVREGCVVISVAAGVENAGIDVYAMPNIAAEFCEAMSFVRTGGPESATGIAVELFSLVGKVMTVDDRQMKAGNMLAGCGIAYVMRMIRAMMEGGVEMGLYPQVAKEVAIQAMQGAVSVLNGTGLHPEAAIDRVTTAGGLTIRGLNELDHAGFNSAVIRCLKAGL